MKKDAIGRWFRSHFIVVGSVVLGLVFAGLSAYRYSDSVQISDDTEVAQKKQESIRRNTRMAVTLADDLARLESYSTKVNASLMDRDAKAVNLAYFYEVGALCGARVTRVNQSEIPVATSKDPKKKPAPQMAFDQVQFDIGIEGPYSAILKYVDSIRAAHPLIRVDNLAIHPATNATGRVEEGSLHLTALVARKDKTK